MIAALKPYPAMKDSGVPWLGDVPEHWEVRRGKWLFRHRKQINSDRSNSNVLSLTLRGVVNNDPDNPEGLVPKDYTTYQFFRKGDLVFKLIDLENLKTSRVGLVHEDGIMSSAYVRLSPQKVVDIRFFFQQYFDLYQRGIYNQLGAGVRSTLGPTDLLDLSVVAPPLPEQSAIVRFLGYANQRIEKAIRTKRKLIALLNEQKQVIIHRAVTRGLDPTVRLKLSGLEWLGDVPEHWQIAKLVRLTTRIGDGLHGTPVYIDESEYHFINGNNLSGGVIKITPSARCVSKVEFQKYKIALDDSTILMSINGTIGNVAFYRGESLVLGKSAAYINCDKSLTRSFLFFFLQSSAAKKFFQLELTGTTIFNLSLASIRNLFVALPPLTEQIAISSFLEVKVAELTDLIDRAHREITLLREYRTRLTADVVTGKLDVREAVKHLPEEAGEPEAPINGDEPGDEIECEPALSEAV